MTEEVCERDRKDRENSKDDIERKDERRGMDREVGSEERGYTRVRDEFTGRRC